MYVLDIRPAWGFQSYERLAVALDQRDRMYPLGGHRHVDEDYITFDNAARVIGYIPLLNVIEGIARICLNWRNTPATPKVKQEICDRHVVRGFFDIFFGPLLLVVDIVQTVYDNRTVQEYNKVFELHNGRLPKVGAFKNDATLYDGAKYFNPYTKKDERPVTTQDEMDTLDPLS